MADNNRGKSPGTIEASRSRAQSADWSLAQRNAARKEQTHCINGHEFTPENTKIVRGGAGRQCRECGRIHKRTAWRVKKMGAVTHQTGCEHIEPGLYAVKRPTSGAETVVLVVLALGHDRFAVRKAGTDKILTAARSELCITAPPGTATSVRDNATQCPTP